MSGSRKNIISSNSTNITIRSFNGTSSYYLEKQPSGAYVWHNINGNPLKTADQYKQAEKDYKIQGSLIKNASEFKRALQKTAIAEDFWMTYAESVYEAGVEFDLPLQFREYDTFRTVQQYVTDWTTAYHSIADIEISEEKLPQKVLNDLNTLYEKGWNFNDVRNLKRSDLDYDPAITLITHSVKGKEHLHEITEGAPYTRPIAELPNEEDKEQRRENNKLRLKGAKRYFDSLADKHITDIIVLGNPYTDRPTKGFLDFWGFNTKKNQGDSTLDVVKNNIVAATPIKGESTSDISSYEIILKNNNHRVRVHHDSSFQDYGVKDYSAQSAKKLLDIHLNNPHIRIQCAGGKGRTAVLELAFILFDKYSTIFPSDGPINMTAVVKELEQLRKSRPGFIQKPMQLRMAIVLAQKFNHVARYSKQEVTKSHFQAQFEKFSKKWEKDADNAIRQYKPVTPKPDLLAQVKKETANKTPKKTHNPLVNNALGVGSDPMAIEQMSQLIGLGMFGGSANNKRPRDTEETTPLIKWLKKI